MNYKDYVAKGLLKKERIKPEQITRSINRADQDIKSASKLLSTNEVAAFKLAYDSMLIAGRALVFSYGFRPRVSGSHKTVVDFTTDILGKDYRTLTLKFDQMRKKRHTIIYDAKPVSKTEAKNAIKAATNFIKEIKKKIQQNSPQQKLF